MREYALEVPDGMATTVLLSDDDAKRAGLLSEEGQIAPNADPKNQPENQTPDPAAANETGRKDVTGNTPNKQGTAENKS